MKQYFCISDVHSYYDAMIKALNDKGFDINNDEHILVSCGDFFDRGTQSRECLEYIMDLPEHRCILIRGNHDDLLEDCCQRGYAQSHDYSNGTWSTIKALGYNGTESDSRVICAQAYGALEEYRASLRDYYETEHFIFVHGWIPTALQDTSGWWSELSEKHLYCSDWRELDSQYWDVARWTNGMKAWKQGAREPNKTIVCGHWHCSYGWSHIDQQRKEFPPKNHKDWEKSFEPYVKEGIIAIDACTAYTGFVNCVVVDERGNIRV